MHGIISALKKSKLFTSIDVIDLIDEEAVKLIKIRAFKDWIILNSRKMRSKSSFRD